MSQRVFLVLSLVFYALGQLFSVTHTIAWLPDLKPFIFEYRKLEKFRFSQQFALLLQLSNPPYTNENTWKKQQNWRSERRITSLNSGAFMLHISLLEFPLLCMHLSLGSLQQQQHVWHHVVAKDKTASFSPDLNRLSSYALDSFEEFLQHTRCLVQSWERTFHETSSSEDFATSPSS
jgi:hypothetical protein